jgi:hypothetical protein
MHAIAEPCHELTPGSRATPISIREGTVMNTYKTYVQLDASGRVVLEGLPFPEGAILEVLVVDQSRQPGERVDSWRALMGHVQGLPQSKTLTDEDIAAEVDACRRDG